MDDWRGRQGVSRQSEQLCVPCRVVVSEPDLGCLTGRLPLPSDQQLLPRLTLLAPSVQTGSAASSREMIPASIGAFLHVTIKTSATTPILTRIDHHHQHRFVITTASSPRVPHGQVQDNARSFTVQVELVLEAGEPNPTERHGTREGRGSPPGVVEGRAGVVDGRREDEGGKGWLGGDSATTSWFPHALKPSRPSFVRGRLCPPLILAAARARTSRQPVNYLEDGRYDPAMRGT